MAVLFAPQYIDPNAELKQYMLQFAQMMGDKRTAKAERGRVKSFAESISPPDISTINDQRLFSPGGQESLQAALFDGGPAAFGQRPGQQTLSPQQILQKALMAKIEPSQAIQFAQLGRKPGSGYTLSPGQTRYGPGGQEVARGAPKLTEPFKKTSEETQRDRDMAFLNKGKGKPFQDREAEERLKALPPGNLIHLTPSKENDKIFEKLIRPFIGEIKPTATRKTEKFPKGRTDKIFGQTDFETLVVESIKEGLKKGVDPASMEATAREWWNRQFEKAKDKAFQKFQNPAEFQQIGEPTGIEQRHLTRDASPEQIIQKAADEGLLTAEDVQSITAGLQADPSKLQDVLDLIERKRSGK